MARLVQKFGGTSAADIARLERVALTVRKSIDQGHQVIVVISAMAGVTNQLTGYTRSLAGPSVGRAYDTVWSSGEQVTCGLLAIALEQIGVPAQAFLGWQVPIITDDCFGNAQIQNVSTQKLQACWDKGITPVVAGFQGVTADGEITTLGRGGSDTTAVAIAAAINADWCDIYTDVTGVFTADPRIVSRARKLEQITYEEMFELAAHGAKVLQKTSVEMAMKHQVRVRVLSSFIDESGTDLIGESDLYRPYPICGITHSCDEAYLTLNNVKKMSMTRENLTSHLSSAGIHMGAFVTTEQGREELQHLSFLVPKSDVHRALQALDSFKEHFSHVGVETHLAKISIVGFGLRENRGITNTLFETLYNNKIPLQIVAYSPLKVSLCVSEGHVEKAVQALHHAYGLDTH